MRRSRCKQAPQEDSADDGSNEGLGADAIALYCVGSFVYEWAAGIAGTAKIIGTRIDLR